MNDDVVRGAFWANDLTRLPRPEASRGQYTLVEVRPLWLVPQLARAMEVEEPEIRERLARGCRAFAAWSWLDEALVSWLWVSTGEEYAPPLRRTLRIPAGDCYAWNAGTLELHRGQGLFAWLVAWAGWRMAETGPTTMWGGILDGNLPSRHACVRAGFRPVLRLLAVHEPAPGRLRTWAVEYADPRLVARARQLLEPAAGPLQLAEPANPAFAPPVHG